MQHMTLRTARKRRRLSVRALSRLAGIHSSTVSRMERGVVRPLHENVVVLEQILGVTLKFRPRRQATKAVA